MLVKKIFLKIIFLVIILVLIYLYWNCLPTPLFTDPVCTVLEDRKGNLLGAHIASDGQWRFPANQNVPEKFRKSVVSFEDKRFYFHSGFDKFAFSRALWRNIKAGKIVSGGSTITMQTIRLSRKGRARTITEKIIEIILASRLELSFSKEEILSLYISNAPFGGNVVGLDAAAWRYFARSPDKLSWAETATLTVLPNCPGLIHPGRNRKYLKAKRNNLLKKLNKTGIIDYETYELSLLEPIPEKPKPFPQIAPHLLSRIDSENKKNDDERITKIGTTLNIYLQKQANIILNRHYKKLAGNQIHNAAAIIVEVETNNVLAYVGNVGYASRRTEHGSQVDIITAERSTGSILKPFLYAAMLTSGEILPEALIADIPTQIGGYAPKNYNLGFDGAVPAKRALARSLNVPAIRLLQKYGVERFHYLLKKIGMTTINKPAGHYGLSLILGGCEGKLWELAGIYASMARTLNHFSEYSGKYDKNDFSMPDYLLNRDMQRRISTISGDKLEETSWFSAASIWLTFNTMLDVERPAEESSWRYFSSSQKIAWKTGTSFGFRDAWAIGITPDYVVGVWVGNADGEGRPDLIGIKAAAPVLFDIFNILPASSHWFEQPYDEMVYAPICSESGYIASEICEHIDSMWIPETGLRFPVCPYHKIIHLDATGKWRVHSECESPDNMLHKSWFILPPAMEWYYKTKNSNYKTLPAYRQDCLNNMTHSGSQNVMEIIYPKDLTKIYVPVELDGSMGSTIFEVAHRNSNTIIFWHVDAHYIGQTKNFHHIALNPSKGKHTLTLIDENGEKLCQDFEIIDKD